MSSTRAPYYPTETLETRETPFGMIITDNIQLYDAPIKDKVIYKYDILLSLSKLWGTNMLRGREYVWKLVSGDDVPDDIYRKILAHSYKRFSAFANYIDDIYLFGDPTISLHKRIIQDAHKVINERRELVVANGKYIGESRGYIYMVYPKGEEPKYVEGVVKTYA